MASVEDILNEFDSFVQFPRKKKRKEPKEKRCTKCKVVKPIGDFYRSAGVLKSICKVCDVKANKAYLKKNPHIRRAKCLRYRTKHLKLKLCVTCPLPRSKTSKHYCEKHRVMRLG